VVLGLAPVLLMWVTFLVKNALRVGGYGAAPGEAYGAPLLAAFHASGTFVKGLFAVEQGAFYCSIVLAAVTVFIIEKQLVKAACCSFAAAGLSLVGLLHAWRFTASDTVSALPLLERITGAGAPGGRRRQPRWYTPEWACCYCWCGGSPSRVRSKPGTSSRRRQVGGAKPPAQARPRGPERFSKYTRS
jgi:hypothetical protein